MGLNFHERLRAACILLLIAGSGPIAAQTITVVDASSLLPLEGAHLTSDLPGTAATTDAKGRASIAGFAAARAIRVAHLGYLPASIAPDAQDGAIVRLQRQAVGLDEVVISANRFEDRRRDVPEQVDAIGRERMGFLNQPTTPGLLESSGTLYVQRSQMGGGSPVIRGFEASRVLLVVDGVRLNNAIYRAGHLQDLMTVDQNALARIEVISGPGSVVYGSDALGGVIHLITRQPRFRDTTGTGLHGAALLRLSSANGERTGSATLELRRRRIASLTSITASGFGDLRAGSVRDPRYGDWGVKPFVVRTIDGRDSVFANPDHRVQAPTGYEQLDILQKLRLRTGAVMHTVNAQLSTSSAIPRYDRLSEYAADSSGRIIPAYSEWYYGPQQRFLLAYTLEAQRAQGAFGRMRLTPSYQAIAQSRHSRSFGSSRIGRRFERVQVLGLSVDFEKRHGRHQLRYGAEAYANSVGSEAHREHISTGERTYLGTRYPSGGAAMSSFAAYAIDAVSLGEHWVLTGGLRASHVGLQARFDDDQGYRFLQGRFTQRNAALNGRLGAVFTTSTGWRFTALLSSGFRAPNVDDLAKVFDSTPGTVVVPNPDLRPERTVNLEAGAARTIGERLHVEAVAFRTWYMDALVVEPFRYNGLDSIDYDGTLSRVTALTNARQAYLLGAQGRLSLAVTKALLLTAGLTHTYGRVRTAGGPRPLDHVPPTYGRAGLLLRANRLEAEAYALFNGWKRLSDTDATPGSEDNLQYATPDGTPAWWTINARCSFALSSRLQLQAAMENIADHHYRTFASGVSAPGRNAQISLRVHW
ncbi:MAG: TonB-dependent receptor [Flavobacteriales bacterium]|nr:MAG: TonB-dependent receptor [Flavobacteriales bacterium]